MRRRPTLTLAALILSGLGCSDSTPEPARPADACRSDADCEQPNPDLGHEAGYPPCVPSCEGLQCGKNDGCGGECTGCPAGEVCWMGSCAERECVSNQECGDGFCDGYRCLFEACLSDWDCVDAEGRRGPEGPCQCRGITEGGATCDTFCTLDACVPNCDGRACGGDGCGGTCGGDGPCPGDAGCDLSPCHPDAGPDGGPDGG